MRIRRDDFSREFECSNCLLTRYGRKRVEKYVKTVASLEMVEEDLDRDTRAYEHRSAAQDVRIAVHNLL